MTSRPGNQVWGFRVQETGPPLNVPLRISPCNNGDLEWNAWGGAKGSHKLKLNGKQSSSPYPTNQLWIIRTHDAKQGHYKIHSAADENLVVNAWGGAGHANHIALNGNTNDANSIWQIRKCQGKDGPGWTVACVHQDCKFEINAWGGNNQAADLKCNGAIAQAPGNQCWNLTPHGGALGSVPVGVPIRISPCNNTGLEWNAWGGAKGAAELKLNGVQSSETYPANQLWIIRAHDSKHYKIHSLADENLVVNCWGGAGQGHAMKLNGNTNDPNSLWRIVACQGKDGPGFTLSSAHHDGKFQANAWGGNSQAAALKCNGAIEQAPGNQCWVFKPHGGGIPVNVPLRIFPKGQKGLEWNAWGGAKQAAKVKLNGVQSSDPYPTNQLWVIRNHDAKRGHYKIHSYADENLVVNAWGGAGHGHDFALNGNTNDPNSIWRIMPHK